MDRPFLHLSAQSQHTLFVSPGPVHVVTRDRCLVVPRATFFLSGEQKQGQQTSRMAHKCLMTATAKRVIVQWCLRPNQLLTGSMWSARGVEGLNAASHKDILFGSCLSAKRSQPQIAPDRHTGVNAGSCWANTATYCHSVRIRSSLLLTTHALIFLRASYFSSHLPCKSSGSPSKLLGESRRGEPRRGMNYRVRRASTAPRR